MDASYITNRESLRAWLETQPREVCIWIAARAAARVAPLWLDRLASDTVLDEISAKRGLPLSELIALRPMLIAYAAAATPTPALSNAAARAIQRQARLQMSAAYLSSAARSATNAGLAVTSVTQTAKAASSAVKTASDGFETETAGLQGESWSAVAADVSYINSKEGYQHQPLWPDGHSRVEREWSAVKKRFHSEGHWGFWVEWYDGLLEGRAMPQELLRDIALIDPEHWDAGPEVVNPIISEMWAKYRESELSLLAAASPFEFTFDQLSKVMRMIGVNDDLRHMKDPAVVHAFLDDADELKDGLEDFIDYAKELQGGNYAGVLRRAAEKVLKELTFTRDQMHLRPRRLVMLASDLELYAADEKSREALGETLSAVLDKRIEGFKSLCRLHFGASYQALGPLAQLSLDHIDKDEVIKLFDAAIKRIEKLPHGDTVALAVEGQFVLNDMLDELRIHRAAIAEASSDAFRHLLEKRFAQASGSLGL
ncbi:MAG: hypothetical protein AAF330_04335, partial [Pseudomonadota bacterium]